MCGNCKELFKFSAILEKFSKKMLKRNKGADKNIPISTPRKNSIVKKYIDIKYDYEFNMRKNMDQFQQGRLSLDEYLKKQRSEMKSAFESAYSLGKEFGIGKGQMDDTERRFVVQQTTKEMQFMTGFANDIQNNAGTMPYDRRLKMYSDSLDSMFGFGRLVYLPEETHIIWTLGVTDKHCLDCLSYAARNPYTKKTLPGFPKSGSTRCFVGKGNMYPVLTPDGWVHIHKIKIGDLVLTHKGKWKKVTNIIKYKCSDKFVYKITTNLKSMHGNQHIYYMLNDHKSIVDGKWTRADELKIGDRLLHIVHKCKYCGKSITYGDNRAIDFEYCSVACSSKHIDKWKKGREKCGTKGIEALNEWRKNPENLRKSIDTGSEALKKVHESRIGKTYEELYGKEKADILRFKCTKKTHEIMMERIKNGFKPFKKFFMGMSESERSEFSKHARACLNKEQYLKFLNDRIQTLISSGKYKYSKVELEFINILEKLNLKYTSQVLVDGRFFDFHLTDYDIYIECDGDKIHANPKFNDLNNLQNFQKRQIIVDNLKNEIMKANNKQFLRFWEDDIKNNKSMIIQKITLLLKNHNNEFKGKYIEILNIEKIETSKLISDNVYSLTVEDHESFVVRGGLIAHNCLSNCLCSLSYIYNKESIGGEYDKFILDKQFAKIGERKIPSEYDYKHLMGIRDEYYYNRYMFELTKDQKYKDGYMGSLAEFNDYKAKNKIYFPVFFDIKQNLKDLKEFNMNSKFDFVSDYNTLKSGGFVSFFQGNRQIYGKISNVYGTQIQVKTLEGVEYLLSGSTHIVFKEK